MSAGVLPGYLLEAELGSGSMGTVHLARRTDWAGRLVAVKRVPSAGAHLTGILRREAEVLAALDHPHIVRILDLVPDGEGVAIAMQYASGGSLPDLVAQRGRLTPGEVVAVAAPVADALASAHRRGVLHCDVKPANILFTSDGEPLLSDFGLARRIAPPGGPAGAGPLVGTAEYLDPAVVAGAAADQRSDVYGLGAVCYELLTGRAPYVALTPEAVIDAALAGPPSGLGAVVGDGVPLALVHAVERAMARRPADRFADAAAFAAALRAATPATPVAVADAGAPGSSVPHRGEDPCAVAPPAVGPEEPAGMALDSPDAPGPAPGRRPTRTFGPRPPAPVPTPPRPERARGGRPLLAIGAGLAVVAGLALAASLPGPERARVASRPRASFVAAAPARSCPPTAGPLQADVDGDGCPSTVSWKGTVAEVEGRRFELGRPGDALVVGDWDCDGTATPALYRPSTGEVFLFARWADPGPVVSATDGGHLARDSVPIVQRIARGCDRVTVKQGPTRSI